MSRSGVASTSAAVATEHGAPRRAAAVRADGAPRGGALDDLAPETIARIFAFLDPRTLATCAHVCRTWHTLVQLDTTWRSAFAVAFGLDEREAHMAAHVRSDDAAAAALRVAPALRRLDASSWRAEYTARAALLRRWRKSRTPTILSDPRIATLDALALSQSHTFVLSLSHGFSVASRSNAFTGKVAKDFLDANGFASLAPNGQPNVEFSPATTALATDAHASRIVWGQRSGDVSLTTIDWRGQSARGTVRNRALVRGAGHTAPITAIAFPFPADQGGAHGVQRSAEQHRQQLSLAGDAAPTFATAAADGSVAIWHPKYELPLWRGTAARDAPEHGVPVPDDGPIEQLVYSPVHGIVLAARRSGALRLPHTMRRTRRGTSACRTPHTHMLRHSSVRPLRRVLPGDGARVATLALDTYDAERACVTFLVHTHGARVFVRYDVPLHDGAVRTTVFGAPHISPLTAVRADFDVRDVRAALPASLVARQRAARFTERKFVVAGTASGGIGVWEWDAGAPYDAAAQSVWQATRTPQLADAQAAPALVLAGHTNAITALDMTPALLLAGCEDGTVKALDLLTGHVVRTFNERTARRLPRACGRGASCRPSTRTLPCEPGTIGPQVLAWRTADAARRLLTHARRPKRGARAANDRGRARAEWERVVHEEQALLDAERSEQAAAEAERAAARAAIQGTLDEDDALDYALMLSRETAVPPPPPPTDDGDLPYELLYDELHLEIGDGDSDAAPIVSPTLSHLASPPSRAWDTLHHAGVHTRNTSDHLGAHSKLRTVAVPRSARFGTSPASTHTSSLSSTPLQLDSERDWPEMRPSSLPDRTGRRRRSAHGRPARRCCAPRSRPASLAHSWHLDEPHGASRRSSDAAAVAEDDEDAALRAALERSLHEY
ncbi:hypothetical protein CBS14141_001260 [Malassezia furfur]|nr:hypothetical protein CBS14141_001260 [Malassezia furfur]